MTGRVIAVASGKGGVGKTWFAITLAQALAQHGRRTVLLDADLGLANADVQLGLAPEHDLVSVLARRVAVERALIALDAGFTVLPGRSGAAALADLPDDVLARALALPRLLADRFQEVIVDLGAGLGVAQRRLLAGADLPLILATEEPTSLTDAYAVLKLLAQDAPARVPHLVVNIAARLVAAERVHATLDAATRRFLGRGVRLAGIIRRDPRVPEAIRAQAPLLTRHPTAPAAADVQAIAREIAVLSRSGPVPA